MRTQAISVASLTLAAALVVGGPAAAASNRVWVSGHGVDQAGCGAPTAPCRSLQYAHDNAVNPGGEIDILDPAGYGAISITKPISIINDGVGTAGVQASSGNAITINAGPVILKGLNIDGLLGSGAEGVIIYSGGVLTIDGCSIRHFAGAGVNLALISGTVRVLITNTVIDGSGLYGIEYNTAGGADTLNAALDHVTLSNNGQDGLAIVDSVPNSGTIHFAISNMVATGNLSAGIHVQADLANTTAVDVTSSNLSLNGIGVDLTTKAVLHISRSAVTGNGTGIRALPTAGGGVFTAGDNDVSLNDTDVSGPVTSMPLQ